MHDHFSSPPTFDNCYHAYRNAHHLRELQSITDQCHQAWARQMSQLLLSIKCEVTEVYQHAGALAKERIAHFESRYDEIVQADLDTNPLHAAPSDGAGSNHRHRRTCRIDSTSTGLKFSPSWLTLPFDSNLAERDIGMVKVKQKASDGFRTDEGAKTFCALRGYISTAKKQGRKIIAPIESALAGQSFIPLATDASPE